MGRALSHARILLDTNVLSELMKAEPHAAVLRWFADQSAQTRYVVSAITQAEILLGIALLPAGKKRTALASTAQHMFEQEFQGLNLAFDEEAAPGYASLVAQRSRAGAPISVEDAQIAAIATRHRVPLATRNVKDFQHIPDLVLINPWDKTPAP